MQKVLPFGYAQTYRGVIGAKKKFHPSIKTLVFFNFFVYFIKKISNDFLKKSTLTNMFRFCKKCMLKSQEKGKIRGIEAKKTKNVTIS